MSERTELLLLRWSMSTVLVVELMNGIYAGNENRIGAYASLLLVFALAVFFLELSR